MWRYWYANLAFVIVSAAAFLLETQYHALPQAVQYLGLSGLSIDTTPAMALVLIAILFIAIGALLKFNGALMTAPLIFGAAHFSLAGSQLLPPQWVQYSQIYFAIALCAIVGSFILMDAVSMYRLRDNRFWQRLWVAIAIAAVNYSLFLLFSKGLGNSWLIALPMCGAAFFFLGMLSSIADEKRLTVDHNFSLARLVPGLQAEVKAQTDRAATNHKAWMERGEVLDTLKGEHAKLEGRVMELERALNYKQEAHEASVTPLKAA